MEKNKIKNNKNLPAVNSINLFTSSKNVDHAKIQEVEALLKRAKKIELIGGARGHLNIFKFTIDLNKDTLMYVKDIYSFSEPIITNLGDSLEFRIDKTVFSKTGVEVKITCVSEDFLINLLSNDVNQEI